MSKNILPILLATNFIAILFGAFSKIMHWPFSETALAIGMISYLVFLVFALMEMYKDPRITSRERTMWTFGLLFLGSLGGLIYVLKTRKQ